MTKLSAVPLMVAVAAVALLACQYVECRHGERSLRRFDHHRRDSGDRQTAKHLRIRDPNSDKVVEVQRIRGANQTDFSNYPYMAAIFINDVYWCAGAIVDVNWVLTAAHCLNYALHVAPLTTLRDVVKVRVGSLTAAEGGALVRVVGAVRHPKFEEEPAPHADVALLKLERDLRFTHNINLIKIYEGMQEPFAQSFITVAGWGATNGSETAWNESSTHMLTARLKVRTKEYCEDSYQLLEGFMFTEDFFCASLRNGTRDTCLFDAGAPAIQNNRLLGVMSFGPERCEIPQPPVFIKAFYFRDFVKSTIASYKTPADLMNAMTELQEEKANNEKNDEDKEEVTTETPKEEEAES